ncbi:MAG: squalene/phytoene synthase family protein [Pseudomonadota bacterium]
MNEVSYSREHGAPPGSAAHYATLWMPARHQPAAWALLALRRELDEIVTRIAEPGVAHARLDWWQAELACGDQAQHPIAKALARHVLVHPGRHELLEEMIAGTQDRLRHGQLGKDRDFGLHAYRHDTAFWLILTDMEAHGGRRERDAAHALGPALAWTRVLHQLGRDTARGELLIPLETLSRHALDPSGLMHPRTNEPVRRMLAALGEETRQRLTQARTLLLEADPRTQIMPLVSLAHAEALLDAMRQDEWRLLDRRPELTPLRLLWLAWRTARKARKGRLT